MTARKCASHVGKALMFSFDWISVSGTKHDRVFPHWCSRILHFLTYQVKMSCMDLIHIISRIFEMKNLVILESFYKVISPDYQKIICSITLENCVNPQENVRFNLRSWLCWISLIGSYLCTAIHVPIYDYIQDFIVWIHVICDYWLQKNKNDPDRLNNFFQDTVLWTS